MRGRGIDTPRLQHTFALGHTSSSFSPLAADVKPKKCLHRPGIEPGPPAWQASILPLNQRCWSTLLQCSSAAVVAEWLRRLTRNQFPSGSTGSNPVNCVRDCFWMTLSILPLLSLASSHRFLDSLVVRISACHVEGPGSIPGRGGNFFEAKMARIVYLNIQCLGNLK